MITKLQETDITLIRGMLQKKEKNEEKEEREGRRHVMENSIEVIYIYREIYIAKYQEENTED